MKNVINNNKVINLNYLNAKKYGLDFINYTYILEDKGNNIWILGDDVIKYDPNKIKEEYGVPPQNYLQVKSY